MLRASGSAVFLGIFALMGGVGAPGARRALHSRGSDGRIIWAFAVIE